MRGFRRYIDLSVVFLDKAAKTAGHQAVYPTSTGTPIPCATTGSPEEPAKTCCTGLPIAGSPRIVAHTRRYPRSADRAEIHEHQEANSPLLGKIDTGETLVSHRKGRRIWRPNAFHAIALVTTMRRLLRCADSITKRLQAGASRTGPGHQISCRKQRIGDRQLTSKVGIPAPLCRSRYRCADRRTAFPRFLFSTCVGKPDVQ